MNDPVSCNLEALRTNEAWLRPLLRSLVGVDAADDVLQETWLRAWQRPPRVAAASGAWLARVATRLALTHRRAEARRQRHEGAIDATAPGESTQATVERLALQRAVSLAVAELPEPHRTALLLHHYHGLDVATIAATTSASPANVRQRLHRARQWLRERLARDLGGDWRRAPAIVALLIPPPTTVSLVPAATAMPLLFTMNKARLVAASIVVCVLVGGALLVPQWIDAAHAPAAPERSTRLTAAAPPAREGTGDAGAAPTHREALASTAPAAAVRMGTVLDGNATPVAGVELVVAGAPSAATTPFATSDAAGRFRVPAEWPRQTVPGVAAATPWVVLAVRPPADGATPVEPRIVVGPGRQQVLRIVDPEGRAVPGTSATVKSYVLADFPLPLEDTVEATWRERDDRGQVRHEWLQLPIGRVVITVRKAGFAPVTVPVDATTPPDAVVTLQPLASGARLVSGTVTDARGAYVAAATVGLGEWNTRTGAFGEYTLRLEPGARIQDGAALFAVASGWYATRVENFGQALAAPDATSLTRDLQLTHQALAIRGRVLDHIGAPCRGVRVYPWQLPMLSASATAEDLASPADVEPLSLSGNKIRAFATTDDDGAFTLRGLGPQSYRLRVYDQAAGWAWTSLQIAAGTDGALLQLPSDPMGPVAGRVLTRDGQPATGVVVGANVETHANGGGRVSMSVGIDTTVDQHGRFRIERMPRIGTNLRCDGDGWLDTGIALDATSEYEAIELTILRRCHIRIECTGPAWADARAEFLDDAGERLYISERRRSTEMQRQAIELHEGRTGVLAVAENAATLVLRTRDGKREQRVPVALRPGEVTAIVNSVQ